MKIRELCHSKTFNRNITETYIRKFANGGKKEVTYLCLVNKIRGIENF